MNTEEREDGVLEEETLEIEHVEEVATEPKPQGGRTWVAVTAILALLCSVGGIGAGYLYWQKLTQSKQQAEALSQQLQEQATAQQTQLTALNKRLQEFAKATTEEMAQLRQQVAQSVADSTQGRSLVAEVKSLLRIANRRLQFAGDVEAAIMALQEADRQLRDSGDPIWTKVRERIAIDLTALKGVRQVDTPGISLRLSALSKQVEIIKPLMASVPTVEPINSDDAAAKQFSWGSMLEDSWKAIRSLLVIRQHDQPVPVLLPPEKLYFLKQNLQLRLEAAHLALLMHEQTLYADSLERAASWLQEYFDRDHNTIRSMLDEIDALRQEQITPHLPDISGSLHLLLGQAPDSSKAEEPQP